MHKFPDLRNDHDESAPVNGGTLYRKGNVVQVWWTADVLGRPFDNSNSESLFDNGRETWTCTDHEQARTSFLTLKERWTEPEGK